MRFWKCTNLEISCKLVTLSSVDGREIVQAGNKAIWNRDKYKEIVRDKYKEIVRDKYKEIVRDKYKKIVREGKKAIWDRDKYKKIVWDK